MVQLTSLTKEIEVLSLDVKTAGPTTKLACFGFEIDIANMIVGIPETNCKFWWSWIIFLLDKNTFSRRQLGQVGLLLQECMFLWIVFKTTSPYKALSWNKKWSYDVAYVFEEF